MKSKLFFTLLAASLFAFTACQPSSQTQPDMAQIKSDIQKMEDAWATALNAKDVEALMAMYTDDAVSMPDAATTLTGKAAIRQHQEQDFANQPAGMTFSFETVDVYGNADQVTETGNSTYKNADGKVTGTGKYMCVWEKQGDKYRCTREIYNNDQPSAPAARKSIHLFDLPAGVTEAEWSAVLKDMNSTIAKIGYPGAGYFLYKTENDDAKNYRYYFEGVWPSAEAYAKIHEDPAFKALDKKYGPLYKKIQALEVYRRVGLVQ
ncbi:MAG: SgcJ/EcaC family oxidoreductase [Lewinellaceae bacterium]|nr:SgcJ/EcaC family oxidoreductase [Lewinellaceae bacterium]